MFRSVLIPTDLAAGSERVVERAASLPLAPSARVTLLHVVPKLFSTEAQRLADADATKALESTAASIARVLQSRATVRTMVKKGPAAAEIAKQIAATKADLVVMGRGGKRAVRDVVLGSTAERVLRTGHVPVLVVRLPVKGPYARPVIALDLDPSAGDVLATTLRVIPAPRPKVVMAHAFDAPFQALVYPSVSSPEARAYRETYKQNAIRDLEAVVTARAARSPDLGALSFRYHVRYGSPRFVIAQAVARADADLLVIGTRGHSGVAQAFLGTVAGDVLREVPCDVLVVPPRSSEPEAA